MLGAGDSERLVWEASPSVRSNSPVQVLVRYAMTPRVARPVLSVVTDFDDRPGVGKLTYTRF
jgi:hypothetical protein